MKKIYKIKTLIFSLSSIMFFLSADCSLPSSYEEIEVVSNLPRNENFISGKVTFKNVTLSEVNFIRKIFSFGIAGEASSVDINSIIFDYSTFSRSIPKKISHGDNRYTPIFKLNKRTVENGDLKKLYNWLQPEGKILLRSICSFIKSADNTKKIVKKMMDYSLNNPKRLGAKKQLEFWSKTILNHEQGALRRIGSRCLDKLGKPEIKFLDITENAVKYTSLFSLSFNSFRSEEITKYTKDFCRKDKPYINRLQKKLNKLGLYSNKVDGLFGSGTERAYTDFESLLGPIIGSENKCIDFDEEKWLDLIIRAKNKGVNCTPLKLDGLVKVNPNETLLTYSEKFNSLLVFFRKKNLIGNDNIIVKEKDIFYFFKSLIELESSSNFSSPKNCNLEEIEFKKILPPSALEVWIISNFDTDSAEIEIDFNDFSEPTKDQGVLFNASDTEVIFENTTIPANTLIYEGQSVNLIPLFEHLVSLGKEIDNIDFKLTSKSDYFNFKTFENYTDELDFRVRWSTGNDTIIATGKDDLPLGFSSQEWYWQLPQEDRTGAGLIFDNNSQTVSHGSYLIETDYGTTTLTNAEYISGTPLDDTFIGSDGDEMFQPNGGTDTITAGEGYDQFADIFGHEGVHGQKKLVIKDYQNYEEIEFEDATWETNGSYNFTKEDIGNQFSVQFDPVLNNTHISISTQTVNKPELVTLANGKFEVSHYSLEDELTGLELYLKDQNASRLKDYYWIGDDVDVFGIKNLNSGDRIYLSNDFGFDSANFKNEVSVNYDAEREQTLIDVNTNSYNKNSIVVVDGNYGLDNIILKNNGDLALTLKSSTVNSNTKGYYFNYSMETHPFYEEDTFIQIYDNSECKDDNIIGFSRSDNNKFYMKKNGAWEETEQIELRDYWAEIFDSNTEISTTDCIINTTTKYNNQNYVVFDFMGQLDEGIITENNTEIEETEVSDVIDEIEDTNNENSFTQIKTKEEILTEELIRNLKTKRTTEIDWKSLKCKNQMELDYNIWFDDQSYIKVDIQGYEIILSERKTYTFEGVKRIVLSDFYGNGNNLILDRETLNYSSSDQSDLGECRVLFTLEEFLNPLVNTIIEGSQKNKF